VLEVVEIFQKPIIKSEEKKIIKIGSIMIIEEN